MPSFAALPRKDFAALVGFLASQRGEPAQGDASSAENLAAGQYRQQARVICGMLRHHVSALNRTFQQQLQQPERHPDAIAATLRRTVLVARRYLRLLSALHPPSSLAALHRKAVALSKRELALDETLASDLANGRAARAALATYAARGGAFIQDQERTWRRLGLPACAG